MSQSDHKYVAELHRHASHAHNSTTVSHSLGDALTAQLHSQTAYQQSVEAQKYSNEIVAEETSLVSVTAVKE